MASDHLDANRSLILERAVVAGALGFLPLPIVDELLAGAVRTTLLRQIAALRNVDADEPSLRILADSTTEGGVLDSSGRRAVRVALRRSFRRLAAALHIYGRADDVAGTFAVATLFDHYCARHHVGHGIDAAQARRLRGVIETAIADARGKLVRRGASRVAEGARTVARAMPRSLLRRAGLEQKLLAAEPAPPETSTALVARTGVRGAVARLSTLATTAGRSWVEELVRAFDARWTAG